jgi:hypothetical protein
VFVAELDEAEHPGEETDRRRRSSLPELRTVETAYLSLDWHRAELPRRELTAWTTRGFDKRNAQAVRIDERQYAVAKSRLD